MVGSVLGNISETGSCNVIDVSSPRMHMLLRYFRQGTFNKLDEYSSMLDCYHWDIRSIQLRHITLTHLVFITCLVTFN